MTHNYAAAIDELKMYQHLMHESGLPILNKNCFDVIEHALAMMQKLQEPSTYSHMMVNSGITEQNFYKENGEEYAMGQAFKAMLEQAAKEIADGK